MRDLGIVGCSLVKTLLSHTKACKVSIPHPLSLFTQVLDDAPHPNDQISVSGGGGAVNTWIGGWDGMG